MSTSVVVRKRAMSQRPLDRSAYSLAPNNTSASASACVPSPPLGVGLDVGVINPPLGALSTNGGNIAVSGIPNGAGASASSNIVAVTSTSASASASTNVNGGPLPSSLPLPSSILGPVPVSVSGGSGGGGGTARSTTTAASKKVFVGGLSWETDERSLRDYFGRWGLVSDCVIMRDRHTGHPRGFGFVTYEDECAAALVAAARHELDGRQVEAKRAVPRSECAPVLRSGATRATKKVFVGGLPATCGQEHFAEYFARFGAVADAQVMYDHHTGNSRGFGFVTFVDEATVDRVCDHEAHDIMGKFVDVKRAEPRQVLDARRNAAAAVRTGNPTAPNTAAAAPGVGVVPGVGVPAAATSNQPNVWGSGGNGAGAGAAPGVGVGTSSGVGVAVGAPGNVVGAPGNVVGVPGAGYGAGAGAGTLECATLYAPDVAHAVHRNLYSNACPAERMSMHARPVAAARVERRYHPYASRERRVLRSYW